MGNSQSLACCLTSPDADVRVVKDVKEKARAAGYAQKVRQVYACTHSL